MNLCRRFITVPIAEGYEIVEAVFTVTDEFVFILYHHNESWPAIHAKIRYLGDNNLFIAFAATPLHEGFQIAGAAHEFLEFDIVSTTEEILRCMYVNNAMTRM